MIILVIIIAFISGNLVMLKAKEELKVYDEVIASEDVLIEGYIGEIVNKKERYFSYMENAKIKLVNKDVSYKKILIYFQDDTNLKYGNKVLIRGKYKEFSKARNPGNYDEEKYYKSLGVACKFNALSYEVIDDDYNKIMNKLLVIKGVLKRSLYSISKEKDASVFTAMLLGDRELDEATNNLYKDNGISHILSISGLHISIIGLGAYKLLRRRFLFPFSCISGALIMIAYGLMVGGAVSIIRAITMFILKLISELFGRTYDITSSLGVAGLIILLLNPFFLLNIGFLLSFLAIMAIALFAPISEKFFGIQRSLFKGVNASAFITVLTLPVLLNSFFEIPSYSVIINLIVIPFTGILLISGLAASILGLILLKVGYFFIGIAYFILRFYELICYIFSSLPYSMILVGKPSTLSIYLYYFLVLIFAIIMNRVNRYNPDNNFWKVRYAKWTLLIVVFIITIGIFQINDKEKLEIIVLDTGQGESILIQMPKNKVVFIDNGSNSIKDLSKYRVIPTLKYEAINEIDYFFISHTDNDHISGLLEILNNYKDSGISIKNIVFSTYILNDEIYNDLINIAKSNNINIIDISPGMKLTEGLVNIRCLYPYKNTDLSDKNASSMVLSLEYNDFSMIFTGDINAVAEEELITSNLLMDYDILKVAHHGSDSSTSLEFLEVTRPEYAIISCGINNVYGHPHEDTLDRLKEYNCVVYSTNRVGAVRIGSDGKKYSVEPFITKD